MNEIKIGNQVWASNNLNVSVFSNGDNILEVKDAKEWIKICDDGIPAWCFYENNFNNENNFGKLYNWPAVSDSRNLAPKGWRIPNDNDWQVLADFLQERKSISNNIISSLISRDVAIKLKSESGWLSNYGNNETGFNAVPAGGRFSFALFNALGTHANWWSSEGFDTEISWYRYLCDSNNDFYKNPAGKHYGLSIRCLKN